MGKSDINTIKFLFLTSFGLGKSAFWGRFVPITLFCLPSSLFFYDLQFEISISAAVLITILFAMLWDETLAFSNDIKVFPNYTIGAFMSLANPLLIFHIYWAFISLFLYSVVEYTGFIKKILSRFPNSRAILLAEGISNGIMSMLISHILIMTLNLVGFLHFIGAI